MTCLWCGKPCEWDWCSDECRRCLCCGEKLEPADDIYCILCSTGFTPARR
jgi:hypothetical protein